MLEWAVPAAVVGATFIAGFALGFVICGVLSELLVKSDAQR